MVCHVWPGITPFNVWDLELDIWVGFALAADQWVEAKKHE